jgi:RecB family exonuclease
MSRYIISELNAGIDLNAKIQIITPSKVIACNLKVPYCSLETLARNIVRRQGWGIASALLSRRLLQNAVGEVIETKDVAGIAQAFLATIKDLLRTGIDLTQLVQNSDPRIQQLGNLALAYQRQLRQRRVMDAAELYWEGVTKIAYQKAYCFYGYFAPGKDELALINAIAGEDSIFVLPINDLFPQNQKAIDWLQTQGWSNTEARSQESQRTFVCPHAVRSQESDVGAQGLRPQKSQKDSFWSLETSVGSQTTGINQQLQQCFQQQTALPTGVSLTVFPNLEAEVRGVLTQVKVLLTQGVDPQDIVLVTKEEQLYGEVLIDIAWEYNLPVQVAYEIPLEQTRIGAWLKLLLEVVRDNFPFEATAKLLSHPLAKYMSPEIWATARQTHPQGLSAWQQLGVDLSLLDFPKNTQHRGFWLQRLQDILTTWDVLEKAKGWAREVVAFYRFQEALKEIAKPEGQILSKQAFFNEINEILALLTVPAQPGMGGIALHNPTSLLGTQYPYVFVLGSAEGILPTAIADDPILDFYSRKRLVQQGFKVTTAVDLAQKETFYFYCLLGIPTQAINFSYPELIERQPTLPSPFITRLGLKPTPIEDLPLASIELARQVYLRQPSLLKLSTSSLLLLPEITQAWQVETNRESAIGLSPRFANGFATPSAIAPDEYGGVIGIKIDPETKIFSASQLTQLGQCPFKWFSARLLKLKELTEAESDLSAAYRGNLYHRCLELSLAQIKTASDLAKFNQEQLVQAFSIAEKELNLTQLSGWEAQRQEHLDLLTLNLTTNEFLPPDREVIARETKFTTQWYGLQVQGQVDRIDRTTTGLTVIDYKTSSATPAGVKDATGKANIDIQLAVYQDAIAEQYPDEIIDTAAYYSVTKQKTISRPKKDPTELAAFAEQVKSHLEQGHYPVSPDKDRKACSYCAYDLVCRLGDRINL